MNILIVEDEPLSAKRLQRLLGDILHGEYSGQQFSCLEDATEYLSSHSIDLLFLDLNLNGEDGFEILRRSVAESFHTIVVSGNYERAIEAFEYGVLDFIAKPYTKERLSKALARLSTRSRSEEEETRYLTIKKSGRLERIDIDDIAYIRAEGGYSQLVMLDKSEFLHDKNLDKLLALLPNKYYRVHRSYVIALDRIKAILRHEGSRYELEISGGETIPLGRTRYKELQCLLNE